MVLLRRLPPAQFVDSEKKFPILVIDELLDELSNAKWFTSLDLHARFNQIRLAPGEEHKTDFQTHWGHFKFIVMAFRLTGAPNTFQGAMNTTLHPFSAEVRTGVL
jgi:hypothetical protein